MTHLRFKHTAYSFREARLLRKNDTPAAMPSPEEELKKAKSDMETIVKKMDAMQKRLDALETTRAVLRNPSSQYDARAVPRPSSGLSADPSYGARLNKAMNGSQYYPQYTYDGKSVVAQPNSRAALQYFKPGHVVHRIDPVLGRIEFVMDPEGQWRVNATKSVAQISKEHDDYQEMWRQRDAAKKAHDQYMARRLHAMMRGEAVASKADIPTDFAQEQYVYGMAKGERPLITNNPFLINNPGSEPVEMMTEANRFMVPGTSEFTPVYREDPIFGGMRFGKPRSAKEDARVRKEWKEFNDKWDAIDAQIADLRGQRDGRPASGGNEYDNMYAGGDTDQVMGEYVRNREARKQGEAATDFAPRSSDTFKYNKSIRIAIPSRMGQNGGEDVAVKITVPKELSGLSAEWMQKDDKTNVISYFPREGMPRSEHDRSIYERAGIVFRNRYNSAGALSAIDVYFQKEGEFQVAAQGSHDKTSIFNQTIDSTPTQEQIDYKQKQDELYRELSARPKGQWHRLQRGIQGSRGYEYMYRIKDGVAQAYNPIDGLSQFDRVNAEWFRTGGSNPKLDEQYDAVPAFTPTVEERGDGAAPSAPAPTVPSAPATLPPDKTA